MCKWVICPFCLSNCTHFIPWVSQNDKRLFPSNDLRLQLQCFLLKHWEILTIQYSSTILPLSEDILRLFCWARLTGGRLSPLFVHPEQVLQLFSDLFCQHWPIHSPPLLRLHSFPLPPKSSRIAGTLSTFLGKDFRSVWLIYFAAEGPSKKVDDFSSCRTWRICSFSARSSCHLGDAINWSKKQLQIN